ncbi:hypothetical protein G3R49_13770 [Shewanella sp. WXL01]|nr:hypothetical protein [Shewanella sp. WXL01]NKF51628.1 hypothetical protein [Shewanella sp. WXL01]
MATKAMRHNTRKRVMRKQVNYFMGTFNSMIKVCFVTAVAITAITLAVEAGMGLSL